jgi:hypothetical protein
MARVRRASAMVVAALISSVSFGAGTGASAGATAGVAPGAGVNLVYHGGPVIPEATNYVIFWEPPLLQDGTPAHVSSTYNQLVKRYFNDVGGSGLYENNTQYYQVRNGQKQHIQNASVLGGTWLDTSPYPRSGCTDSFTPGNCVNDKQLRSEVLKAMEVNGWTAGHSHMFFVFTADGEGSCVAGRIIPGCAFVRYCAWHNYFRSDGALVVYANQPYPGTRIEFCGVPASPNHDPSADATLSLVSHEQMEAVTDLNYRAWWRDEAQTGEIADICFTWQPLDEDGGKANQVWNGHYYILQEEWSNAAKGCVQEGP